MPLGEKRALPSPSLSCDEPSVGSYSDATEAAGVCSENTSDLNMKYRSKKVSKIKSQTSCGSTTVFHHQPLTRNEGIRPVLASSVKTAGPGTRNGAISTEVKIVVDRLSTSNRLQAKGQINTAAS